MLYKNGTVGCFLVVSNTVSVLFVHVNNMDN
jgi:hypothetical protein